MKNTLKTGLLALAIATSFAACKGNGSATADSVKVDSASSMSTVIDSSRKDTTSKPDSLKRDTITTTTTKTAVKTSESKKN